MGKTDQNKIIILEYLSEVQALLNTGEANEHSYRPAFKDLIEKLNTDIQAINEPAYTGGNAPDFLFKRKDVPIARAECKNLTINIKDKGPQEQANRYVAAWGRILLTNYYDFEIINESGELETFSIAKLEDKKIIPLSENFNRFVNLLHDYLLPSHRTIKSAKNLAIIMANKACLLRDNALAAIQENKDSDIYAQFLSFKQVLIHELTEEEFADMYAQTLVYGLFVARYFDPTLKTFSRYEAQDLLPSTNPLLKKFFGHVAGTDYDPKIAWLVDSLIEAYLSTNVYALMHKEFEKKQKDPVLHFYETFLTEYDSGLRKSRGVYYTPEPVVSFIVRSVDEILKSKFDLPKGLADTSKIEFKEKISRDDKRTKDGIKINKKQIHKVQILDPAVGTGTFLNEVILEIYKKFKGQEGMWSSYIKNDLLPRLHGFELMMASYTMAHLKLGITLNELGYKDDDRLSVWLTNSLEEGVHEVDNFFMSKWLTHESNQAAKIKNEMPIMVVLGNPPYSVSSSNKGEGIMNLIKVYKEGLEERNIQTLSDDYIKFIRFAENQIEKTGYGVVAMITNNSFLDGVTHRQMRKHLMETFDEIYVLDLHGNSLRNEVDPNGGVDQNVFNIMQGVSINLFVKTGKGRGLADVYHSDLFGRQKDKYKKLNETSFKTLEWKALNIFEPYYFFVPKNFNEKNKYDKGFSVTKIFNVFASGIKTHRDHFVVDIKYNTLANRVIDFFDKEKTDNNVRELLKLKDNRDWNLHDARKSNFDSNYIKKIQYRPFDYQWIYYDKILIDYGREVVMKNMLNDFNYGLCLRRTVGNTQDWWQVFVSKDLLDINFLSAQTYLFPLYFYQEDGTKTPNLDQDIWQKINNIVGKTEPEDILDYIYAVLHSPKYRKKYKEFLKIDFPRVPYPKDKSIFKKLVKLGKEIRELHLLESDKVNKLKTTFPSGGSNVVEKKYPKYENEKVFINENQYFGKVSQIAWEFYIGGYQPAQKWLKDRRERELSVEDIEHYQKMIVALVETDRLMGKIDEMFKI